MSQPPQNGWGQPPAEGHGQDGYGQSSPNAGYGDYGQGFADPGYGQDPNAPYAPAFGDGAQGMDPQQGEQKSGAKIPILICAGCAVIALILGIIGGGIFLFTRGGEDGNGGGDPTTQEETTEPSGDDTTEPNGDDTTEPGGDETTEPSDGGGGGGSGEGTRDAPYAAGETFTLDDGEGGTLEVSIGNVNWDATQEIMDESSVNDAPGDGEVHIMVPVKVTYRGPDSALPFMLLSMDYVADSGNSYSVSSNLVPNGSIDQNEIYDGGSVEYNETFTIPADAVKAGTFKVSVFLSLGGEEVWVAAQ